MEQFRILLGDCLEVLPTLADESIQTCITSPPYWGLRDYGTATWDGGDAKCDHKRDHFGSNPSGKQLSNSGSAEGHARLVYSTVCGKCGATRIDNQLGLEETPEAYVASMVAVFREVRRVLRNDGTLWLNLGDSYFSKPKSNYHGKALGLQAKNYGTGDTTLGYKQSAGKYLGNKANGMKDKDLVGIPWRVAFALQADGWFLRQDIIWHKPNPMPESVRDRCTKAHEYIFLMAKSVKYYYDAEAIKEALAYPNETRRPLGSKGAWQIDGREQRENGGGKSYDSYPTTRNKRSVWKITTKPFKGAHFATFPPDLIEPCVLAGSADKCCPKCGRAWERVIEVSRKEGREHLECGNMDERGVTRTTAGLSVPAEYKVKSTRTVGFRPACDCGETDSIPSTVLDPFNGAGTTGVVAIQHGRRYTGIELNSEYLEMASKRIQETKNGMTFSMGI